MQELPKPLRQMYKPKVLELEPQAPGWELAEKVSQIFTYVFLLAFVEALRPHISIHMLTILRLALWSRYTGRLLEPSCFKIC